MLSLELFRPCITNLLPLISKSSFINFSVKIEQLKQLQTFVTRGFYSEERSFLSGFRVLLSRAPESLGSLTSGSWSAQFL